MPYLLPIVVCFFCFNVGLAVGLLLAARRAHQADLLIDRLQAENTDLRNRYRTLTDAVYHGSKLCAISHCRRSAMSRELQQFQQLASEEVET